METARRISFVIPAALLLAACSTEPNAMHRISFSATTGSAGAHASGAALADLVVSGTGGSVSMSSAQMVLSRIKLAVDSTCSDDEDEGDHHEVDDSTGEHTDTVQAGDHGDDDDQGEDEDEDGCAPVRAGPVLVDVPLDGTTKIFLDGVVPAGTYTGLRAKLDAVDSGDTGGLDFITAHPEFAGVSVKVVGTFTDSGGANHSFTFISHMKAPIHSDFDSPVTVDASSKNLTIEVDVSRWFKTASGAIIDPTNPENQRAIERSIRASLRAFEDDNHDGDDDHGEHHGDDGH